MKIIVYEQDYEELVNFLIRAKVKVLSKKKFANKSGIFFELEFKEQEPKKLKPGPKQRIDKRLLLEMRRGGSSLKTVAENMHCSKSYVQKVIREYRIKNQ